MYRKAQLRLHAIPRNSPLGQRVSLGQEGESSALCVGGNASESPSSLPHERRLCSQLSFSAALADCSATLELYSPKAAPPQVDARPMTSRGSCEHNDAAPCVSDRGGAESTTHAGTSSCCGGCWERLRGVLFGETTNPISVSSLLGLFDDGSATHLGFALAPNSSALFGPP